MWARSVPEASLLLFNMSSESLRTKAVIIVGYCASLNREKAKLNGKTQICKFFCGSIRRVQNNAEPYMSLNFLPQ